MPAPALSMSGVTVQQVQGFERAATAQEYITRSVKEHIEKARATDQHAAPAGQAADQGGEAVCATVNAMQAIVKHESIVDDIADPTKRLAPNASIEGGRAAEHGRGLSGVAAENRKLAKRSQHA